MQRPGWLLGIVALLASGDAAAQDKRPAPELAGGVAWFNAREPITMKSLRGKIVLLDFWTFG